MQPATQRPPLRILSNLARAGGTLVSRCLGAMDNVVLLSEIHPRGTQLFNPVAQAHDWYGLLDAEEAGKSYRFIDAVQLIEQRCRDSGKTLTIRDWSHLDYIGKPFVNDPPYRSQLVNVLEPAFRIIRFSLVRHPVDQWVSTASLDIMQGQLDPDDFLCGYRRFAEDCMASGFMRFEDFTREPGTQLERLCRHLETVYDPGFLTRWGTNTRVTGDISKTSRGSYSNKIQPLERHIPEQTLLHRLRSNPDYRKAVALLEYEDTFTDD